MKNFLLKYAGILSAFALFAATLSANQLCGFHWGETQAPASLRKLRKF